MPKIQHLINSMNIFSFFKHAPTVAIHDGKFHCDDLFAVATLMMAEGDMRVVRTRDESIITKAEFVADVGGIYDPAKNRFDHHQKGGAGFHENGLPYASFGLVWKKYGEQLCGSKDVAFEVEQHLVSQIDADDNGVAIFTPKGDIFPRSLQSFFYAYRPTWKEDQNLFDENFLKLIPVATDFLKREIIKARDMLEADVAILKAYTETVDKRFLVLDKNYPFEEALADKPEVLFVVRPRPNGSFGVGVVPDGDNYYAHRKPLPETWAGLRDADLARVSGVPDAVFCHNARFLAVAKTKQGALALVQKALEN